MKRLKSTEVARDIVRWLNHANLVVHRPPKNSRENSFCENGPAVYAVTRQHSEVAHERSNLSVVVLQLVDKVRVLMYEVKKLKYGCHCQRKIVRRHQFLL